MAATTTDQQQIEVRMIPLAEIRHDQNVRQQLHQEEVDALASSIALLGQLSPVSVRPDVETGAGFLLIAGHKRYAALKQLGHTEIRAEIRPDDVAEASERAAENLVRSQLTSHEEALAVKAMLDRGLTEDGAAQALGWPKARVTARVKLLELPEQARELIGSGAIALSAVDPLLAIGRVSPPLLEAVIAFVADGNEWAAERLPREPGWVIDSALRATDSKVFAAHLSTLNSHEIEGLRLGKKTEELLEQATGLHKQLDRYAYGPPPVRFSDTEVDRARAAGVVVEFENSAPLIMDRPLYRELCKEAIKRTVGELEQKLAAREAGRKANRRNSASEPQDPVAEARREEQRALRELAEQAHGVNLDLGASLLNGLSTVDEASLDVARFFTYGLLGAGYDGSPYTQTGERVARLATSGIRLVIDEFRTDATKTKKDGTRGRLRIDYGDPRDPQEPVKWLFKYLDGARSAGELFGRALVVICAEQYACRLVVPQSQRTHPTSWSSHKDHAAKALRKLAGPHIPATLKQLEKAIARAHAEHQAPPDARHSARVADAVDEVDRDTTAVAEHCCLDVGDDDDQEVEAG